MKNSVKQIPVFVISLKSSVDRRQDMHKKLSALGIDFNFFDAVDGRNQQQHAWYDRFNGAKRRHYHRRPLWDTEKACFISHAMLWEECLRTAQPVLIFEDDQMIDSSFSALLPYLSGLANQYGVIRLEGVGRGDYKVIANIQGCDLVEWNLGQYMSGGYVLSPQAANILLNKCYDIIFPVDNFMDMYWWHGVRHISFYPFICTEENIASTIRDPDYVSKLNLDKANENIWHRTASALVRFFYKRRVDCYKMYARLLNKPVKSFKW